MVGLRERVSSTYKFQSNVLLSASNPLRALLVGVCQAEPDPTSSCSRSRHKTALVWVVNSRFEGKSKLNVQIPVDRIAISKQSPQSVAVGVCQAESDCARSRECKESHALKILTFGKHHSFPDSTGLSAMSLPLLRGPLLSLWFVFPGPEFGPTLSVSFPIYSKCAISSFEVWSEH